ncbi:MAG: GntR family transcriptional regulator, partial [Chitinivibrionales bacterium]|nr:GntR family transcriptional regulator [Chitinivibrionales bacterium]MBD3358997.1 GntR family transcriptional regulator [Chitinivibrionales bacterium]
IFNIVAERKVARSMEIADRLNVKRPTVTTALRALADKGLVNYEPRSYVTLTERGERIAKCVDKRHHVLREVFTKVLLLPDQHAEEAACMMEHGMNTRVCRALTGLLTAVEKNEGLARALNEAIGKELEHSDCETACGYEVSFQENKTMNELPDNLNTLGSGQSAHVLRITGGGTLKKRLREMGITAGERITVVKSAPLDDPIEIKVRNYNMSLRREEAARILIQ